MYRVEHGFVSHRSVTIMGHAGAGPVSPSPTCLHTTHPATVHGLRQVLATAAAASPATGQTACQVSCFVVSFLFLFKFLLPPNIERPMPSPRPKTAVCHVRVRTLQPRPFQAIEDWRDQCLKAMSFFYLFFPSFLPSSMSDHNSSKSLSKFSQPKLAKKPNPSPANPKAGKTKPIAKRAWMVTSAT